MDKLILSAGLLLMPLLALADVSGTWTAAFDTQIGEQSYTYEFAVDGMKLTGMAKSANGESEITDGKIEGDKVTFIEHLNYQGMMLDITYTGKIISADEVQFMRDVGGQGGEEFTAKRKKDKM